MKYVLTVIVLLTLAAGAHAQPAVGPDALVRIIPGSGVPIDYQIAQGVDQGTYRGPGFQQQSFALPRSTELPSLAVFYRPDMDGRRQEVVLELSDAVNGRPDHLPGYRVELRSGAKVVLSGSVPKHYLAARWRLQSAPRPRVHTPAELMKAGLVPAYDTSAGPQRTAVVRPYTPMGMAGVTPYLPTTGERDDIGLLPAWTAQFLATNSDASWKETINNAEAASTLQWHWRDETGQIFNIDRHPDWSIDGRFAPPGKRVPQNSSRDKDAPAIDEAHQPELSYVAFLITGDPYYLEELQFQANWHMWDHGSSNGLGLVKDSQVRGLAWTLREIALAAAATPADVPKWLLPKDYFLRKLENNRKWYLERTVETISPVAQAFHFPWTQEDSTTASWQEDYNSLVLGLIVRLGFENWRAIYDWACVNLSARGDGKSGWPREVPVWYYIRLSDHSGAATAWAELARMNSKELDLPVQAAGAKLDLGQFSDYMAALRMAASAGHAEMVPILRWYEDHIPAARSLTVKYAISPQGATAPRQPDSAGDRQFVSSRIVLPPQPGRYKRPPGAEFVLGVGNGQTLIWDGPDYYKAVQLTPNAVLFEDIHGGVGSFVARDVKEVRFLTRTWDMAARDWRPNPKE